MYKKKTQYNSTEALAYYNAGHAIRSVDWQEGHFAYNGYMYDHNRCRGIMIQNPMDFFTVRGSAVQWELYPIPKELHVVGEAQSEFDSNIAYKLHEKGYAVRSIFWPVGSFVYNGCTYDGFEPMGDLKDVEYFFFNGTDGWSWEVCSTKPNAVEAAADTTGEAIGMTAKDAENLFNKGVKVQNISWKNRVHFIDNKTVYDWEFLAHMWPVGWVAVFEDSTPFEAEEIKSEVLNGSLHNIEEVQILPPDPPIYYTPGMKVGHYAFGNGEVYKTDSIYRPGYPVVVRFGIMTEMFTYDGKRHKDDKYPSLFQQEITTLTLVPVDTRIELPEDVTQFLSICEVIRDIYAYKELKKKYKI